MIKNQIPANNVRQTQNRLVARRKRVPVSLVSSMFPGAASLRCLAARKTSTFLTTLASIVQKTQLLPAGPVSRANALWLVNNG